MQYLLKDRPAMKSLIQNQSYPTAMVGIHRSPNQSHFECQSIKQCLIGKFRYSRVSHRNFSFRINLQANFSTNSLQPMPNYSILPSGRAARPGEDPDRSKFSKCPRRRRRKSFFDENGRGGQRGQHDPRSDGGIRNLDGHDRSLRGRRAGRAVRSRHEGEWSGSLPIEEEERLHWTGKT